MQRALPPWGLGSLDTDPFVPPSRDALLEQRKSDLDALPPLHDPLVEAVVTERFKRMALPSRRIAVGFPWPPEPDRPWLEPSPGAVVGVDRVLRASVSTRLTGIVGLSLSTKHPGQRGDTLADPLGPLLAAPLPPPAGSTPCPNPPRYFPCPLTREDRKKLDRAEPVIRHLQAEMDAPENLGEIERLVARVQAGETAPLVAPWLEQRMEEAGLADDERQLVRLLFHDRPDLAEIPGSAIVFTRRDPATGEDLGPALTPVDALLP